ncbi:phage replisome organizer N-terminal domain-containing protein [Terrisporobacter vanillatitrophus]|uniref:phage replisome organizer N-terminal domain-containing protein n=1 Tax=Terrisporobacter vanillatitrophus TaxID=3058402 RepID=UPI00336812F1
MGKRYYWLKVQRNFFRQKSVKKLKQSKNGNEKVLIYLELLALSLENDNKLIFEYVEDTFEEDLALEIDEDPKLVKETVEYLKKQNLIECVSESEYVLLEAFELTGSEDKTTKRVRKHRENKKDNLIEEIETDSNKNETGCNVDETGGNKNETLEKEKEIDIEIDIEKDIDKNTNKEKACVTYLSDKTKKIKTADKNLSKITKLYESNIGPIYPANRDWFIEISEKIQADLFNKAIEICIDKSVVTPSYLKGIIKKWINDKIFTLDQYKAKEIELLNKENRISTSKNKKTSIENHEDYDEEIDEAMLKEIKELEAKLGVV